jgi:hypothetical protein
MNEKKKVAFLLPWLKMGGTNKIALHFMKELSQYCDVTLILSQNTGELLDQGGGAGGHNHDNAEIKQRQHDVHRGLQPGDIAAGQQFACTGAFRCADETKTGIEHIEKDGGCSQEAKQADFAETGKKLPQFLSGNKAGPQKYADIGESQLAGREFFHEFVTPEGGIGPRVEKSEKL